MTSLTLSPEELIALTGYKRAAEQCRFLDAAGVLYRLNKEGKPVVARTNAERYLGVKSGGQIEAKQPNWAGLKAA
jgi:hypothetical protein